jgi:NCS2 family nucleobase:cation symporter-2
MKPSQLLYGLEDRPPLMVNGFLGLQHVSIIAIAFVMPILLVHEGGGSTDQITFLISMSMLAGGIGSIVQASRLGPLGSGYFCPQVCGPSFLAASVLCVKTGGLPLVFGMTAFAGVVEGLFSRVVHRLRVLFPTEVTGLIVAMVGVTVVKLAGRNFLALDQAGNIGMAGFMVGVITLLLMVSLNVWTKGKVRLFCVLIGMVGGYGAALLAGELTPGEMAEAMAKPLLWNPFSHHPGWSFDAAMILPVTIAVLCSSLKSVGDLTTCQKINDTEWKRPELKNVQKGILADAVGCFSAGILGGFGQSTSSSNIGLTIATGVTSRAVAFSTGVILMVLAFCPKLSGIFAVMPPPVVGATLIFAVGFMIVAGIQIIMSRMLDARKTFVIGLSMIFGLMVDMIPEPFVGLHPWLQAVFSSSLSAAAISALVLNLIFRIGVKSKASLRIAPGSRYGSAITAFMERQGGAWAARPEIVKKAAAATTEYVEGTGGPDALGGPLNVTASFDEYNLDVTITHPGEGPVMGNCPPGPEEMLTEDGARRMAGFLVCSWADTVTIKSDGGETRARLHFAH